jgi:hypothetical protein
MTAYRDRALAVFQRLESVFYDPTARIYRPTQGDTSSSVAGAREAGKVDPTVGAAGDAAVQRGVEVLAR